MTLGYRMELRLHGFCEMGSGALDEFREYVEDVLYPICLGCEVRVGERFMEIEVEILEMNREDFEWIVRSQIVEDPYVEGCETRMVV